MFTHRGNTQMTKIQKYNHTSVRVTFNSSKLVPSLLFPVDDGTGVINCLCWKNEKWRESGDPLGKYIQKCTYVYMGSFIYILNPVHFKCVFDSFYLLFL